MATFVAWQNMTLKAGAEEPAGSESSEWKKRRWGCRKTILGPSDVPYTQSVLSQAATNWVMNQPGGYWSIPPSGPPTGGLKVDGPVVLEWDPENPWVLSKVRDPSHPQLQNWQNPADGKWYGVYLYDYIEEKVYSNLE